jgi:hypothetical protein
MQGSGRFSIVKGFLLHIFVSVDQGASFALHGTTVRIQRGTDDIVIARRAKAALKAPKQEMASFSVFRIIIGLGVAMGLD